MCEQLFIRDESGSNVHFLELHDSMTMCDWDVPEYCPQDYGVLGYRYRLPVRCMICIVSHAHLHLMIKVVSVKDLHFYFLMIC